MPPLRQKPFLPPQRGFCIRNDVRQVFCTSCVDFHIVCGMSFIDIVPDAPFKKNRHYLAHMLLQKGVCHTVADGNQVVASFLFYSVLQLIFSCRRGSAFFRGIREYMDFGKPISSAKARLA